MWRGEKIFQYEDWLYQKTWKTGKIDGSNSCMFLFFHFLLRVRIYAVSGLSFLPSPSSLSFLPYTYASCIIGIHILHTTYTPIIPNHRKGYACMCVFVCASCMFSCPFLRQTRLKERRRIIFYIFLWMREMRSFWLWHITRLSYFVRKGRGTRYFTEHKASADGNRGL